MPRKAPAKFSRRCFLATAAALAARPAAAATPQPAPAATDVIIVGAGAAGIAAARRIAAAGRRYVLVEASDHIGGRCVTDTKTFGVPYDRGAHWIYAPDLNPLTKLTPRRGIEIYPAPPSQKIRIGRRYAREGELEDFLAAEVRATRAINDAARKADVPCEQVMPNDLGDWRGAIEFMLGPFGCGKELSQFSALDFARAAERTTATFCRQGFGALLAALAEGITVQLSTPVKSIDTRRSLRSTPRRARSTARAAIVTVSTNVIAAGRIQFSPELPHRNIDAFGRLSLGSYDHIALELVGNPLGLDSDDLVFEKSTDSHTAAMLANVSGTPLCVVDVAGAFGRDLSAHGEAAMVDFATRMAGGALRRRDQEGDRPHARHALERRAFTLGAFSAAVPGAQLARRIMMEPVNDAIWFAGEAAHETLWGTVGGAWESGERAADAVLRRMGVLKTPAPEAEAAPSPSPSPSPRRKARVRRRASSRRSELRRASCAGAVKSWLALRKRFAVRR